MEAFAQRAKDFVILGWLYKSGKKIVCDTGLKRRFFFLRTGVSIRLEKTLRGTGRLSLKI